mgnify:CR=1 FL=1
MDKTTKRWSAGDMVAWESSANGGTRIKVGALVNEELYGGTFPAKAYASFYPKLIHKATKHVPPKMMRPRVSALRLPTDAERALLPKVLC